MAVSGKLLKPCRRAYAATPLAGVTLDTRLNRTRRTAVEAVDTFYSQGVVAQLDEWGIERFNFPQQVWLYPDIAMGFNAGAPSEVLAVNILTRLIRVRNIRVFIGVTSRRALQLAPTFVGECLSRSDAHRTRYTIPISALRAWLAVNR